MPSAEQRTTDIVAGPGGVMTDEVGVVTGELTLLSELSDGRYVLKVQYKGAAEWYRVSGATATLVAPEDLDAIHNVATALLNHPET
jgi:hypothetical protein